MRIKKPSDINNKEEETHLQNKRDKGEGKRHIAASLSLNPWQWATLTLSLDSLFPHLLSPALSNVPPPYNREMPSPSPLCASSVFL